MLLLRERVSVSEHHLLTREASEGYYLSSPRSRTLENILSAGVLSELLSTTLTRGNLPVCSWKELTTTGLLFIKGWTFVWFDIIWTMLFFRIKPLTDNLCCVLNY